LTDELIDDRHEGKEDDMKVMMWIVMALVLVADLAQAQDETKPDEAPVVFTPTIEKADELPAYVEPEPYDPNDQRLVDILLWVAGAAAVILVVVMLLLKLVRRMKKAKVPGSDTQQCPACKKQWKKYDFLPLPRIAVPRRVINIGNAQLVLLGRGAAERRGLRPVPRSRDHAGPCRTRAHLREARHATQARAGEPGRGAAHDGRPDTQDPVPLERRRRMKPGEGTPNGASVGLMAVIVCILLCLISLAVSVWSAAVVVNVERQYREVVIVGSGGIRSNWEDIREVKEALIDLHEIVEELSTQVWVEGDGVDEP